MYRVHEDAITKSQRTTDVYGNVTSTVELDPWGANTARSSATVFQPQNFTSYTRDGNGDQDAMARRYSPTGRFSQPDPYSGSYDFSDSQSLNRYAYVGNDPVNRKDPSGLNDYGLGPPPPVPIFRPDVLVINVNSSRYPVGGLLGRLLGNDAMAIVESATEGIEAEPQPSGPGAAAGAAVIRAAALLKNNDCSNFMSELISISASLVVSSSWGGSLTPGFGPLVDQNGNSTPSFNAYYALNEYETALAQGRVGRDKGSVKDGNNITIGETQSGRITWHKDFYNLSLDDRALQTLHESLHLIPNFSDFVVAGAAHILATRGVSNPGEAGQFKDRAAASLYINEQIAAHCRH